MSFLLGALMTIGIGLYAPCMIMVSLLGMNPIAAFPIMMGSCAFLMPFASLRFIRFNAFSMRAALGLTLGGIPGVLIAAYIVNRSAARARCAGSSWSSCSMPPSRCCARPRARRRPRCRATIAAPNPLG